MRGLLMALLLALAASPLRAQANAIPDPPEPYLRPGDVVKLRIWGEPDLSGEFQVHADGTVVFPRLGRIDVTRLTLDDLEERLTREYQALLQNPSIEVLPLRRIHVLGEVRQPGLYTIDPTMTLREALALAGGPTSVANLGEIELLRDGRRYRFAVEGGPEQNLALQSGDEIRVPATGWLSRNWPYLGSIVTAFVSIVVALAQ